MTRPPSSSRPARRCSAGLSRSSARSSSCAITSTCRCPKRRCARHPPRHGQVARLHRSLTAVRLLGGRRRPVTSRHRLEGRLASRLYPLERADTPRRSGTCRHDHPTYRDDILRRSARMPAAARLHPQEGASRDCSNHPTVDRAADALGLVVLWTVLLVLVLAASAVIVGPQRDRSASIRITAPMASRPLPCRRLPAPPGPS